MHLRDLLLRKGIIFIHKIGTYKKVDEYDNFGVGVQTTLVWIVHMIAKIKYKIIKKIAYKKHSENADTSANGLA